MLNEEEKQFIAFWETDRLRRRRLVRYVQYGLPLVVAIGFGTLVNLFAGWYKQATMIINTEPSLILVLMAGLILIVVFISIFTVRHRWEQNEQRYKELLSRQKKE